MIIQFTDAEILVIRQKLRQRYDDDIELQLSVSEMVASDENASDSDSHAAVASWFADNTNFAIYKLGLFRFRAQYYYTPHEQYDTGIAEYDAIEPCVERLIECQSAHHRDA